MQSLNILTDLIRSSRLISSEKKCCTCGNTALDVMHVVLCCNMLPLKNQPVTYLWTMICALQTPAGASSSPLSAYLLKQSGLGDSWIQFMNVHTCGGKWKDIYPTMPNLQPNNVYRYPRMLRFVQRKRPYTMLPRTTQLDCTVFSIAIFNSNK